MELRERLALVRRQQEVQPCLSLASENRSLLHCGEEDVPG